MTTRISLIGFNAYDGTPPTMRAKLIEDECNSELEALQNRGRVVVFTKMFSGRDGEPTYFLVVHNKTSPRGFRR